MTAAQAREIEKLRQQISKLEAEIEYKNEAISTLTDRIFSYRLRLDSER